MRSFLFAVCSVLFAFGADKKQSITIKVVSNSSYTKEFNHQYTTPGTSRTDCSVFGNSATCNTTTTPAKTTNIASAVEYVTTFVETETHRMKITCTASWRGSNCSELMVGDSFPAEMEGVNLRVHARKGGNMGKEVTIKFKILDMRSKDAQSENLKPNR